MRPGLNDTLEVNAKGKLQSYYAQMILVSAAGSRDTRVEDDGPFLK